MTAGGRWIVWAIVLGVLVAACDGGGEVQVVDSPPPAPAATETPVQASDAPASDPTAQSQESPEGGQRRYTVRSGDTLFEIARQFGTTVEAIVEANDIDDPDVIDIGQELVIPRE